VQPEFRQLRLAEGASRVVRGGEELLPSPVVGTDNANVLPCPDEVCFGIFGKLGGKMTEIAISDITDELVLYFDTKEKSVNAYTLASALIALADAAKEANKLINPGYEVEVMVAALVDGSFKAVVRTVFKELNNLFSYESVRKNILSLIAAMIYDKYFAQKPDIRVTVSPESVMLSSECERIIIPKEIFNAKELLKKSKRVNSKIDAIALSSLKDEKISGIGFSSPRKTVPDVVIARDEIEKTFIEFHIDEDDVHENIELTTVEILRAILEKSDRLWEFVWFGNAISAPVNDELFYKNFRDHRITIAPGDKFNVRLKVTQRKDKNSGIYINSKYEIIEVIKHIPRVQDSSLSEQVDMG
jgi:hypothetical protein